MSFSVNTNGGALVALQYLTATQGQLSQTQSHINSGLKVATARDDGAVYAIAKFFKITFLFVIINHANHFHFFTPCGLFTSPEDFSNSVFCLK